MKCVYKIRTVVSVRVGEKAAALEVGAMNDDEVVYG
jgi:hypothetical protein